MEKSELTKVRRRVLAAACMRYKNIEIAEDVVQGIFLESLKTINWNKTEKEITKFLLTKLKCYTNKERVAKFIGADYRDKDFKQAMVNEEGNNIELEYTEERFNNSEFGLDMSILSGLLTKKEAEVFMLTVEVCKESSTFMNSTNNSWRSYVIEESNISKQYAGQIFNSIREKLAENNILRTSLGITI